jgi:hypothetical protein
MAIDRFTLLANGLERILMLSTITSVGFVGAVANYSGEVTAVIFLGNSASVSARNLNAHLACRLFSQAEQPPSFPKA